MFIYYGGKDTARLCHFVAYQLPTDPKACQLQIAKRYLRTHIAHSRTPIWVQGLVKWSEQGDMRTPLGVRGNFSLIKK